MQQFECWQSAAGDEAVGVANCAGREWLRTQILRSAVRGRANRRERANFRADGSNLWLSLVLVLGGGAFVGRVVLVFHCHCGFETANTISDSFAEFWKFLRPEHEQSNPKNHQQMHGLKKSFEQCVYPSLLKCLSLVFMDRGIQALRPDFPYAAPAPGNNPL